MRELIDRLDVYDGSAASALRVIDHFDQLVERRPAAAALIRAAAALARCPAGYHDASRDITQRFTSDGQLLAVDNDHTWPTVAVPGRPGSFVWIERAGAEGPLDPLILERWTRALQSLTQSEANSTPASVRIACDPDTNDADRRAAAAALGCLGPITVVATAPGALTTSRSAQIGDHLITLFLAAPTLAPEVRAGVARAEQVSALPRAVAQALTALRLADRVSGPSASVLTYSDLGPLASIVERFTPEQAADVPDVRLLENLRRDRPWLVDTLQAVLDQPSLRQAARVLHLHHSTLMERLDWMANRFGYVVTAPGGRQRAAVTILLWRVSQGS